MQERRSLGALVLAIVAVVFLVIVPPIVDDAGRLERDWPQISARTMAWIHRRLPFCRGVTTGTLERWFVEWTGGSPVRTFGASLIEFSRGHSVANGSKLGCLLAAIERRGVFRSRSPRARLSLEPARDRAAALAEHR